MDWIEISRFFGFQKNNDLIEILRNNAANVKFEFNSKTSIQSFNDNLLQLNKLAFTKNFGFSLSYPISSLSVAATEKKHMFLNLDLSCLNNDIASYFVVANVSVVLFSVQYSNEKLVYNFFVKGVDKKTDDLLKLM